MPNRFSVVSQVGTRLGLHASDPVNSRDSCPSHPSLQFLVKTASPEEVGPELINTQDGLVQDMHHLVVGPEVASD